MSGQHKRGVDIDLHNFLPGAIARAFYGPAFPQQTGIVQQSVQMPELFRKALGQLHALVISDLGQVHGH